MPWNDIVIGILAASQVVNTVVILKFCRAKRPQRTHQPQYPVGL